VSERTPESAGPKSLALPLGPRPTCPSNLLLIQLFFGGPWFLPDKRRSGHDRHENAAAAAAQLLKARAQHAEQIHDNTMKKSNFKLTFQNV
jgi:hypothetical protein